MSDEIKPEFLQYPDFIPFLFTTSPVGEKVQEALEHLCPEQRALINREFFESDPGGYCAVDGYCAVESHRVQSCNSRNNSVESPVEENSHVAEAANGCNSFDADVLSAALRALRRKPG
ncbi:MAG: hypothetical protein KDD60_03640 [Bdellovibrionales bacterium]|nr:hypothetical protein [Bdellovibrionales bacterium]